MSDRPDLEMKNSMAQQASGLTGGRKVPDFNRDPITDYQKRHGIDNIDTPAYEHKEIFFTRIANLLRRIIGRKSNPPPTKI